jgi:D-alanyl-D-alanine dipeptidase
MSSYPKKYVVLPSLSTFCAVLLISSCAAHPPREKGTYRKSDLVELVKLDPTIRLDIRYATSKNFAGRPVYSQARAFLQRPAAEALVKANKALEPLGYHLLVFDGYRPWSVTKLFWDITSKANKKFVANPKKGSRHNRGCAVDLSLWDIAAGKEVSMTGEYDEMSPRSYSAYAGGTSKQRALRDLLKTNMEQNGFKVFDAEWWHFDYQDWKGYRIQNIPFENL